MVVTSVPYDVDVLSLDEKVTSGNGGQYLTLCEQNKVLLVIIYNRACNIMSLSISR